LYEAINQTFLDGTPVELVSGYLEAWDGSTIARAIAGICRQDAQGLSASGIPKPVTYGNVPYQASAVNIPLGVPISDGRNGVEIAAADSIFHGQVGPSQTVTQANVGVRYGMTKDSDGHWYVDTTKSTYGNNTVVIVEAIDADYYANPDPRGVFFSFDPAAAQLIG
jgi:hypothetical protein